MIPALSIRQPWAWLIVNGHKDIENRDWPTVFRGELLVHAGQTLTRPFYDTTVAELSAAGLCPPDLPAFEDLPRGGLVGWNRIVITDLRDPVEEAMLRRLGAKVVRVHRPELAALPSDTAMHVSEQHHRIKADADILNDGSMQALADAVLECVGLLEVLVVAPC